MGIFDFIKQGAQELFIARPDDAKTELIWKWPDETIPMKSQVTVGQDEEAVFFNEGKLVGTLPAGRHTLDSSTIPFLGLLIDKITGGNIFRAQLWFVTTHPVAGQKFGGSLTVQDPRVNQGAKVKVHGDYSMEIFNAEAAIDLYGLQRSADEERFSGWFSKVVFKVLKDRIAEQLVKQNVGIFQLDAYVEEIETLVLEGVKRHVEPSGIRVLQLGNFTMVVDEKDAERIQARYQDVDEVERFSGKDLTGYQQFAAAKAMKGAGEGMAKGGAGGGSALEGAGLGVGFGMAQMFQQGARPAPAPAAAAPPAAAPGTAPCPKCQAPGIPGKFCGECGTAIEAKKAFCSACGKPKNPGVKFCSECGAPQG